VLQVDKLKLNYGPVRVLQGISFEVERGSIVALLGGNAAGKTSTLRAISGLVRPQAGQIYFEKEDITALPTHEHPKRGLAYCPAERQLFLEMSVLENLEMGTYLFGRAGRQSLNTSFERVYAVFPILKARLRQRAGTLSGGEQKMLAIARSLMSRPKLLLLDEPSLGLAPAMVEQLAVAITDLNRQGVTILLAEQNVPLAAELAQRFYFLERGRIVEEEAEG
jgi:branched-chain amino acid transport system ATP-binding protein